jgi:hypothetical protein
VFSCHLVNLGPVGNIEADKIDKIINSDKEFVVTDFSNVDCKELPHTRNKLVWRKSTLNNFSV